MIDGNVEKSLHLGRMQIDRDHAIRARPLHQIRHQLGGDRRAAFVFAILPGVAEIRNHRRHPLGTGAFQAIDPDKQLHQVRVHRMRCRLNDKTISPANVFLDFDHQLAVRKQLGFPRPSGICR